METRSERAETTLAAIVGAALDMAVTEGLESISIGEVAKRLELSKSGVFSRVGSREQLQVAVLLEFDKRFVQTVFVPAMSEARGLPRLQAVMRRWLNWASDVDRHKTCLYTAGAFEYDDREGPVREHLLDGVLRWRATLRRTVLQAVQAGHLRADLDAEQMVFEMDAIFTILLHDARFLRDPRALERAERAWQRLLKDSLPSP
ncbi:AcrR family transcriptional regulator [Pelomonas saccharophila]|uniref:AcrR family transcriptional regulator n=1 Tax=Roseateles saccharophilus TaxID=304 RepID=A0ABU1YLB2_ROSSA|nr:TetR/AcrR family transcriptional regulator [Roseateles saccharophilus]MDR7269647.1 AcrR family transcriptional regulator [Roseateles saccharophilus]